MMKLIQNIKLHWRSQTIKNIFKTSKIPSYLIEDVHQPDLEKIYNQSVWRLNQIQKWFDPFGKEYFLDLDIWHLDNIKKL